MLRVIHLRLKNINQLINLETYFIKLLVKIFILIREIVYFFANLIHGALPTLKDRKNIISSFGIKNKHSENYMNYFYAHRGSEGFAFKDLNKILKMNFQNTSKTRAYIVQCLKKK